jgi:hypothetical protein
MIHVKLPRGAATVTDKFLFFCAWLQVTCYMLHVTCYMLHVAELKPYRATHRWPQALKCRAQSAFKGQVTFCHSEPWSRPSKFAVASLPPARSRKEALAACSLHCSLAVNSCLFFR